MSKAVGNTFVLSLEKTILLLIVTSNAPERGGLILLFILILAEYFSIKFVTRTKSG